jgi:nitroreductase
VDDNVRVLMEIIKNRRSVRRFSTQPVAREDLDLILEAARWAPSAGNSQPWEFVVITQPHTIRTLKMVMPGVMGNMKEGPVLLGICLNTRFRSEWSSFDLGCALQNMLLCVHALGLGACAIGGFDRDFVKDMLELPEESELCLLVTLGHPAGEVKTTPRRALDDLIVKAGAQDG